MEREKMRTPRRHPREKQQGVTFAPAKPFFRSRLIMQLLTLAAVVLAFTLSISIFFKVETVLVTGGQKHSAWSVSEASGIEKGDSLLFFGRSKAAGKIKLELPYVDTVRFEVKLPGTVNIIITEKPLAYALQDQEGHWWLMTSEGKIAEKLESAENSPVITGVLLNAPAVGKTAVAAEAEQGSTVLVTATAADRLEAAKAVLHQLENYELFSSMTELDVTDLFALHLYCDDRYRIELGDTSDMAEKIAAVKVTMQQLGVGDSGVLKLLYRDEIWQVLHQNWSQG